MTHSLCKTHEWRRRHRRLFTVFLLSLLFSSVHVFGQTVAWENNSPSLTSSDFIIEGEANELNVEFAVGGGTLTSSKIQLTLPDNFVYNGISSNTSDSGVTIDNPAVGGSSVTFDAGSISSGQKVRLKLNVLAKCGAITGGKIVVKVLSGTQEKIQKELVVSVKTPIVQIKSSTPTIQFSGLSDEKEFTLNVSSVITANSALLILKTVSNVTLSDFQYNGASVTATDNTSGNDKFYKIELSNITSTDKELKFKSKSSMLGTHTIETKAQYPANGTGCNTQNGVKLTMSYPGVSGVPYMKIESVKYVASESDDTLIDRLDINMDGNTETWVKTTFKNTGPVDAYNVYLVFKLYGITGYIDTNNIKYQIGSQSVKNLSASNIEKLEKRPGGDRSSSYYPVHEGKPYVVKANLPLDEIIKSQETVSFWIPTVNGKIYNNENMDVFRDLYSTVINGITSNLYSKNAVSEEGSGDRKDPAIGYTEIPHFRQKPIGLSIKPNTSFTQKIKTHTGNIENTYKAVSVRIAVELPDWMELDGNIEDCIFFRNEDGTIPSNMVVSNASRNGNSYSIELTKKNPAIIGDLHIKVKSNSEPTGPNETNKIDTIAYRISYIIPGGTLDNISQVFQPVVLLKKEKGISLTDFSLHRTTKGLKDSDNNSIPDDGTEALDTEIDHSRYIINDKGNIIFTSVILSSMSGGSLYFPVTTPPSFNINGHIDLSTTAEVYINGNKINETATIVKKNNNNFYVKYTPTSSVLNANDIIKIRLPFITKAEMREQYFTSKCFISNKSIVDPFTVSDSDKEGDDELSQLIATYNLNRLQHFNPVNQTLFSSNNPTRIDGPYQDIFHVNLPSPYFVNEVRRHEYPSKIEWTLPEGYILHNNSITITRGSGDKQGPAEQTLIASQNGNTYVFDLESMYDLNYDGSNTLSSGKWMLPDDRWLQHVTCSIRATKGAPLGNSLFNRKLTYKNPTTENTALSENNVTLTYTGTATTLKMPTSITANGLHVTVPGVEVGNPNTVDLNKVWLYVEGNVSNIKLSDGINPAVTGTGFENRWFEIASVLPAGETRTRSLSFTLKTPDAKTVKVYTVADFDNTSWTVPTGLALNVNDFDHVGARKEFTVEQSSATLDGSLTVSATALDKGVEYTLTGIVSSESSTGAIRNPKLQITVPKGQELVANSAKIIFNGTTTPVSLTVTSDPTSDYTLSVDFGNIVMPGFLSTETGDDAKREARFEAKFKAMCNTDFYGLHYKAEITGSNVVNEIATPKTVVSQNMLPNLTSAYTFSNELSAEENNKSFNEWQTTKTITVKLKKELGLSNAVAASDYLRVAMPSYVNLSGTAKVKATGLNQDIVATANGVGADGKRTLRFSLPTTYLNTAGNESNEITFEIPVEYTVTNTTKNAPVASFESAVITTVQFGDCPSTEGPAGESKSTSFAFLTTANTSYKAFVGESTNLEISSSSFGGKWYASNKSTEVSASTSYAYTPVVADLGERTFYVSSIIDGTDYGMAPVKVNVYASLDYSLATSLTVCNTTVSLAQLEALASGYDSANGTSVRFYQTYSGGVLSNRITGNFTATNPQIIYAQSENTGGKGEVKNTAITVNTPVALSGIPGTKTINHNQTLTLSVNVTTGTGPFSYKWFKDGSEISGATTATYEKATATTADNGVYYVEVTGACGAVNSTNCTVTVNPSLGYQLAQPAAKCRLGASFTMAELNALVTNVESGTTIRFYRNTNGLSVSDEITSTIMVMNGQRIYVQSSNAGGVGAIGIITFTVEDPISIQTDLEDFAMVDHGINYELSIEASGTIIGYQWYKDGVAIAGATGATYVITGANAIDHNGAYHVEIEGGACGSRESNEILLGVYPSLDLTVDNNTIICNGDETSDIDLATLVTSTGQPSLFPGLTLEFNKQGSSEILTNTVVKPSVTTVYEVKAINAGGTEGGTYEITVTVEEQTRIITQPVHKSVRVGYSTSLSVVAMGENLSYQWYKKNGSNTFNALTGETGDSYQITAATAALHQGVYRVEVSGTGVCGDLITSNEVILTVTTTPPPATEAPRFTQALNGSAELCPGDNYTMTVAAVGDGVLRYEWYVNGTLISGAAGNSYTVTNDGTAPSGTYSVRVWNWGGEVTSSMTIGMKGSVGSVAISGLPSSLKTRTVYRISATAVEGATYTWSYSGGSITVRPTAEANVVDITFNSIGSGVLSVEVNTGCGGANSSGSGSTGNLEIMQGETGINDVTVTGLQIYPNPVESELIIKSTSSVIRSVRVTAMNGSLIFVQQGLNESEMTLDASNWAQANTYIVTVTTDKGTSVHKIIKK